MSGRVLQSSGSSQPRSPELVSEGNRLLMGRRVLLALRVGRRPMVALAATTGAIDTAFAPVLDGQVESLAVAPDGLHVFAGDSFTKINGVAQKNLVKLRLSDGARIAAFKARPTPGSRTRPQRRATLHRRHLQDRERRGPQRPWPVAPGLRVPGRDPARRPVPPGHRRRHDPAASSTAPPWAPPSTVTTGIDWSTIPGAFVVSSRLYTGHADGTMTVRDFDHPAPLPTVTFSSGLPTGTATVVSGSAIDGQTWQSGPVRPQPPHVTVPVSCAHQAPVAQGTEQLSPKQQVAGSSPARGTRNRRSEAI